jgi:hypothetical protein
MIHSQKQWPTFSMTKGMTLNMTSTTEIPQGNPEKWAEQM